MELLNICQIRKRYKESDRDAVQPCSFSVNSGEYISIRGVSGSGKSTLLLMMSGLLRPTEGKVLFQGRDIYAMKDKRLSTWRGETAGYLFQSVQLAQALTVRENMLLARKFGNSLEAQVDQILRDLELEPVADRLPGHLSGGQRRRAMIGCVLARNPQIILADEPTNDLDAQWAGRIMNYLKETTTRGKALVLVTHDQRWANAAPVRYDMSDGLLSRGV